MVGGGGAVGILNPWFSFGFRFKIRKNPFNKIWNKSPQLLFFQQPLSLSTSRNFYAKLSITSNKRELNFLCAFTLVAYRATLLCLYWIRCFIEEDKHVFIYLPVYFYSLIYKFTYLSVTCQLLSLCISTKRSIILCTPFLAGNFCSKNSIFLLQVCLSM